MSRLSPRDRSRSGGDRDRDRDRDRRTDYKKKEYREVPKLFAGNIDPSIPADQLEKTLKNMCQTYGQVTEVTVKVRAGSDHSYAFVEFKTLEDAKDAVQGLKGTKLKDKEIKVEMGTGGRKEHAPRPTEGCYVCGRDGHFARDCSDRNRRDRDYGRSRYDRRRSSSRSRHRERRRSSRSRSRSPSYEYRKDRERVRRHHSSSRSEDRRRRSYDRDRRN